VIDLQSAAGDALLTDALRGRPLLALDFDGTLSPLVPMPAAAAMDPRIAPLLPPLIALMPVAVVSGRGIADLAGRIPVKGVILVGNHGNEWEPVDEHGEGDAEAGADSRSAGQRQVCIDWAAALAAPLAALGPGLAFESKSVSLSIHYRLAADPPRMREQLLELIGSLSPAPEIIEGKFVFNLMAPGLVTKFEAVAELVVRHRCGTAIFVGDDVTDERVFERAPPQWLTIRVWDDEASAPGASGVSGHSAARSFVNGVDGVVEMLERLGRLARNL
jgi:trehalose 6-phosphate phosphatase